MPRIDAQGNIVYDSPPASSTPKPRSGEGSSSRSRSNPSQLGGPSRSASGVAQSLNQPPDGQEQVSIYQMANERLLANGLPAFALGNIQIQPVAYIGLLLGFLLLGPMVLMVALLVLAVHIMTQDGGPMGFYNSLTGNAPNNQQQQQSRPAPQASSRVTNPQSSSDTRNWGAGQRLGSL